MTMYSRNDFLVEGEPPAEEHQDDDWSTSPLSPDPTAPSESDSMMYMGMDEGTTEDESELFPAEEPSSFERWPYASTLEEEESDMPPVLPVPVLEPMPSPSSPVIYDYQQDRVEKKYTRNQHIAPMKNHEFTMEYQMTVHGQEYQPKSRTMIVQDYRGRGEITEVSSMGSTALASGVAGAVVGTLVMGTFPGLIVGFYAAYAHGQSGAAGDISRAMGEIALITREKALHIDRKHNLMIRAREALAETWEHTKELDRQHSILQKVKEFSVFVWSMTLHFIRIQSYSLPPTHTTSDSRQYDRIACQQHTTIATTRQQHRAPVSSSFQQESP